MGRRGAPMGNKNAQGPHKGGMFRSAVGGAAAGALGKTIFNLGKVSGGFGTKRARGKALAFAATALSNKKVSGLKGALVGGYFGGIPGAVIGRGLARSAVSGARKALSTGVGRLAVAGGLAGLAGYGAYKGGKALYSKFKRRGK